LFLQVEQLEIAELSLKIFFALMQYPTKQITS